MIMRVLLLSLAAASLDSTTAFTVGSWQRASAPLRSSPIDDDIVQLQKEIADFQTEIEHRFEGDPEKTHPEELAEQMLVRAADLAELERFQQQEKLRAAKDILKMVAGTREYAQSLARESHMISSEAAFEAQLVESMDAQYEDLERLRDMAVQHAAAGEEKDLLAIVESAKKAEENAMKDVESIEKQFKQLQLGEQELKGMLHELRNLKNEKKIHEWHKEKHDRIWKTVDKASRTLSEVDEARKLIRPERGHFFHSTWDEKRVR